MGDDNTPQPDQQIPWQLRRVVKYHYDSIYYTVDSVGNLTQVQSVEPYNFIGVRRQSTSTETSQSPLSPEGYLISEDARINAIQWAKENPDTKQKKAKNHLVPYSQQKMGNALLSAMLS